MLTALSMVLLVTAGADDKAQKADELFKRARALLKADVPAEACPLFEKSHALDPALGTLMNLADCEERTNHLVAAYMHFNDAATWADRTHESQRSTIARDRVTALKPRLSWVALSTRWPVRGLTVKVNAFSVELSSTPQSVPVDPGEAKVIASADTFRSFATYVKVAAASTVTLEIPKLEPVDSEPLKQPVAASDDAPVVFSSTADEARPSQPLGLTAAAPARSSRLRAGPVVMMVGGAAALLAGFVGLGWSYSTNSHFQNQQPGGPEAGAPTVTRGTFATMQWVYPASWVATVAGALALAGGATWLLVPTGSGAALRGTF